MKRVVKAATTPHVLYHVIVGFKNADDLTLEMVIDAPRGASEDELLYAVQEDYGNQILDGACTVAERTRYSTRYLVVILFGYQMEPVQTYNIVAEDKDEAIEQAIEKAKDDLIILDFFEEGERQ